MRRDPVDEFDGELQEEEGGYRRRRRTGLRLSFAGGLPHSAWGRVAAGAALLATVGVLGAAGLFARRELLHDPRFVLGGPQAISFVGDGDVTRDEIVGVFANDFQRNLLTLPLAQRQAELQALPWVKHATVMRLLPNRLRVEVTERTPVAFVREGGHIGLVDADGVLLEMGTNPERDARYSFPVVTGIRAEDTASVRHARMRLLGGFLRALDATGEHISGRLSEVDVSNPEDVKALIPENGTDMLVHFGDGEFLKRYESFDQHLPDWRTQYPRLASVDMRYERQVVLEMEPGAAVPVLAAPPTNATAISKAVTAAGTTAHRRPAAHAVPAAAGPHRVPSTVTAGRHKPELVGHWTPDGKFHAPGKVQP